MKISTYYIIFICIISFNSCISDIDWGSTVKEISLDQSLVMPITEKEFSIADLLSSVDTLEVVETGTEGNIYINTSFTRDLDFQAVKVLGDNQYSSDSILLNRLQASNDYIYYDANIVLDLGINTNTQQQRIDTAELNNGILEFLISTSEFQINPEDVSINFSFPPNRLKFVSSSVKSINYTPTQFSNLEQVSIPLFKYFCPNSEQNIPVTIKFKIRKNGNTITPRSKIYFKTKFKSMSHALSFGYYTPDVGFINAILGIISSVDIGFITNTIGKIGVFKIAEPEINFDITNYMGVNLILKLKELKAYRKNDRTFDTIYANFNGKRYTDIPISPIPRVGAEPTLTTFNMNQSSEFGDIDQLFANERLPDHFAFNLSVINARDPFQTRTNPDFLTNRHRLQLKTTVRFPLKFNEGSYINFVDTIEAIDLSNLIIESKIERLQMIFSVTNKLPTDCNINFIFLDNQNQQLPIQIIKTDGIKSPLVDSEGNVIANQIFPTSDLILNFNANEFVELRKVKKVLVKIQLNKDSQKTINFRQNDGLKVKVGIFVKGNYKPLAQ